MGRLASKAKESEVVIEQQSNLINVNRGGEARGYQAAVLLTGALLGRV